MLPTILFERIAFISLLPDQGVSGLGQVRLQSAHLKEMRAHSVENDASHATRRPLTDRIPMNRFAVILSPSITGACTTTCVVVGSRGANALPLLVARRIRNPCWALGFSRRVIPLDSGRESPGHTLVAFLSEPKMLSYADLTNHCSESALSNAWLPIDYLWSNVHPRAIGRCA
jgi:hypothetical protein